MTFTAWTDLEQAYFLMNGEKSITERIAKFIVNEVYGFFVTSYLLTSIFVFI